MKPKRPKTLRLDALLVERGLALDPEQAQAFILAGEVWSGEKRLEKAGHPVPADLPVEVRGKGCPFVSRSGLKLQHALDHFAIAVKDRVVLDIGASTGGFTDCLLQNGARHVFSVDVGYGQLDARLRKDSRVTMMEKTNARHVTTADLLARNSAAEALDLWVADVSFISLRTIVDAIHRNVPAVRNGVLLFKPQFEVDRKWIGRGGKVRDNAAVQTALDDFRKFLESSGGRLSGPPESSHLPGKKSGNLEYLVAYVRST